ncbi:hypothetical protein BD413DRAFT_690697 [Trametes elegans]|nr:hypothetical protein BD413DRAFT_690697 [Trametes elegans]
MSHTIHKSSVYGSTTQRVLGIPEILELVFSFLETKDAAQCARVCKGWSAIALDSLWRDVDDLHRLFSLLAPIVARETPDCPDVNALPVVSVVSCGSAQTSQHFSRPLEPADWGRFMRYARRVRSFSALPSDDERLHGPPIFDEIARTRPTFNVLPKLSSLSWLSEKGDRTRLSLMFMHDNIKHFAVRLIPTDDYSFGVFFQEIALRMPKLIELDLRFNFPMRDIEEALCKLLTDLPELEKIILPKFTLTAKIIEQLSKSPKLRVVQFEFPESQGTGDVSDVHNWFPNVDEEAFPALHDLSVSVHLPHMIRFLNSDFSPSHLQCLYVHVLYVVPPYQVQEFLESVAKNCKQLTQLFLDFAGDPSPLIFRTSLPDEDRIGWNSLRPLTKLPKLTQFELHWETALAVTHADVEELASSMPALEVLVLNPEPLPTPQPPALTLRALIPFAQHCRNMRELSLCVDASATDTLEDAARELHAALPPVRFQKLRELTFGLSRITHPESIALFLSRLCPVGVTVAAGVSWPEGVGALAAENVDDQAVLLDMWNQAKEWYSRWEEVNHMLPLLTSIRMEERARRSELEREVEDLRVRCRVLEDRMHVGVPHDGGCITL